MSRTALLVVIILFPGLVFAVDAVLSPQGTAPGLSAMAVTSEVLVGTAGEPLPSPLTIRVLDFRERPRAAVRVEWRVASGGGSLGRVEELTSFEGVATARWTLGPETGEQAVEAVIPQATDSVVPFRAMARSGPPVRLERADGPGAQPAVRVVDRYGNPVADVLVTWMVRRGSGSMEPGSTLTNAQGIASARWVPTRGGRDSILATSQSLVGSPVGFVRSAPPPAPVVRPDTTVPRDTLVPDTLLQ